MDSFDQDDLNVDDVMVLDTGDEVYVWIGNGATIEERAQGFSMAEVGICSTFKISKFHYSSGKAFINCANAFLVPQVANILLLPK